MLDTWLDGWSLCLDEMNYLRTGFKAGGLLDIHYVSDNEITDIDDIINKFEIISRDGIRELQLAQTEPHE